MEETEQKQAEKKPVTRIELHPVKRTMKKYKNFSRSATLVVGRFLCSAEKTVLLEGRKDAQVSLHTSIVVVADVIGDHLD